MERLLKNNTTLSFIGVFGLIPTIAWLYSIRYIPTVPITSLVFLIIAFSQLLKAIRFFVVGSFKKEIIHTNKEIVIFVTYLATVVVLNYLFNDYIDLSGVSVFSVNMSVIIYLVMFYCFGYAVGENIKYLMSKKILICILYYAMVVFYILNSNIKTYSLNFITTESGEIYLWLGDMFALLSFFAISAATSSVRKTVRFILSILILFLIGSRASLIFFLISILLYAIIKKRKTPLYLFLIILLFVVFMLAKSFVGDLLYKLYPRMFFVFSIQSLLNDPSVVYRINYFMTGFTHIWNHIICGDYFGIVRDTGTFGGYMHNIFSFWQVFGLIPFILSCIIILIKPVAIWKKIISSTYYGNEEKSLYFSIMIYVILQVLLSRSYTWPYTWIFVGISASICIKQSMNKLF